MKIKNGLIYRTTEFQKGDLFIHNDRICSGCAAEADEIVIDAENKYVIPGLVDIHFHGCAGYDFCDASAEALEAIAGYELTHGITSIAPASMTLSREMLSEIFRTAKEFADRQSRTPDSDLSCSRLEGIHMEGPYISEQKKGAQNPKYLQLPDAEQFRLLNQQSGGRIKLVSIAPELPGSMDFIRQVSGETTISLAHTTADYETAKEAFEAGADHVTHTYNAMPPFSHRAPGVIGAAFDAKQAMIELICDGIHIHPSVIRATCAMFGSSRIVLVSDSMMGTGLKDGQYQLGGQAVTKRGSLATLADGTIAGSVTNLFDCMKNAVSFGIPLADAVRFASENPAKSIKLGREFGTLADGAYADVLILDQDLNLETVIHRGRQVPIM